MSDESSGDYDDPSYDMNERGTEHEAMDSASHSLEKGEVGEAEENKEKVIAEVIGAILILVGIIAAIVIIMNKTQNFCSQKGGADVQSPLCKSLNALSAALAALLSIPAMIVAATLFVGGKILEFVKSRGGGGREVTAATMRPRASFGSHPTKDLCDLLRVACIDSKCPPPTSSTLTGHSSSISTSWRVTTGNP